MALESRAVSRVSDVTVDAEGVRARSRQEAVLDVFFDGRRILSFWLHRDAVRDGRGWLFAWPKTLREFLDGRTDVRVVVTTTGQEVFRGEVAFGSGRGRVAVVNRSGQPISLDKYLKRVVAFENRSPEELQPLLDAIDEVIAALKDVGTEAFLAWGTLLGAHREGRVIGNDADADVAYVSRYTHPVDVIRESFRMQRRLVEHGYHITRYSALAFKVDVDEGDGVVRGLDVFGGFFMDGNLHLMGEIREPFEESWIHPLGTTTLEGRTFPAPADPDRVLTAMYGASWRVPDPAFHFAPPATTVRRLNGWFRGSGWAGPSGTGSTRASAAARRRAVSPGGLGRRARAGTRRRTSTSAAAAARTSSGWPGEGCRRWGWTSSRARTPRRRPATYPTPSSGAATSSSCGTCSRPGRSWPGARGHGCWWPGTWSTRSARRRGSTCGGWPGWSSPGRAAAASTWSSWPGSATTATPRSCT